MNDNDLSLDLDIEGLRNSYNSLVKAFEIYSNGKGAIFCTKI